MSYKFCALGGANVQFDLLQKSGLFYRLLRQRSLPLIQECCPTWLLQESMLEAMFEGSYMPSISATKFKNSYPLQVYLSLHRQHYY